MFFFRKGNRNHPECALQSDDSLLSKKKLGPITEGHALKPAGAAVSDVGCVRSNNEDNYILGKFSNTDCADHSEISISAQDGSWLFAGVFDGMGGGEIGEIAAQTAVQVFQEAIAQVNDRSARSDVDKLIREAFLSANNKIVDLQQSHRVYGTTGTVLAVQGTSYKLYHLGDSRAYLFRDGALFQLTRDQTLAQMKLDVGLYSPDDPLIEADKHKLTEYIGKDRTKEHLTPVESQWRPAECHDALLLCSDGLYDMCSDHEIAETLKQDCNVLEKTAGLIRAALSHGGNDNVTSVFIVFSNAQ